MRLHGLAILGTGALVLAGCSDSDLDVEKLRAALAQASVTLKDTIVVAEQSRQDSAAINAALRLEGDPVFSVKTVQATQAEDVRIALDGALLSTTALDEPASGPCGGITLGEALGIAEGAVGGEAVRIVPDDDDPCMSEIQVWVDADEILWEVKLDSAGNVVEQEESDEDLMGDDDEEEDEADDDD